MAELQLRAECAGTAELVSHVQEERNDRQGEVDSQDVGSSRLVARPTSILLFVYIRRSPFRLLVSMAVLVDNIARIH